MRYAYISLGKLVYVDESGERHELESRFAADYRARAQSIQRKASWKTQGTGARFMGMGPVWGQDLDLEAIPVSFTGLARGASTHELVYSLSTGVVGGVFVMNLRTKEERRLFHSAEQRIEQLATSPDHAVIACSLRNKDGTSNIGVMASDGSEVSMVTDGDSIDLLPAWLPRSCIKDDNIHQLLYQSAGVGRDASGTFVAIAPASIELLDPEHGAVNTLLNDSTRDFFAPKMTADRALYCLRRPYEDANAPSAKRFLLDILLFPFRLLGALLGWLNFFTLRYSGRPLVTSGNARKRSADLRQMIMLGNLFGAKEDADREDDKARERALRNWELVAIDERDKSAKAITSGVSAFDLFADGSILVTNGRAITLIGTDGGRKEIAKDKMITAILALD